MASVSEAMDTGESLTPFEFTVDADTHAKYLEALEGHYLRYLRGRGGRPPIVHPGLLLNQSNTTRSPSYSVGPGEAGVHVKEETRFVNPAYVGQRLRVTWTPVERYERRGRVWSVTDALMVDEDGRAILHRRAWGTRSSSAAPIERRAEQHASVPESDVPAGGYAREEAGLVLRGRPKTVTLERMRLFSGWPRKNIHTDEEAARAAGVPAPIASATQNMGHLCELLIDHFGEAWLQTGTLSLAFIRPVYAGDVLVSQATIMSVEEKDGAAHYGLQVYAANQHGSPVTVGSATAVYR